MHTFHESNREIKNNRGVKVVHCGIPDSLFVDCYFKLIVCNHL